MKTSALWFSFLKTYKWYCVPGLVMLLITNIITMLIPLKIKSIFNLIESQSSLENIIYVIFVVIVLALVLFITRSLSRILCFIPGRLVEHDLRNKLFTKLSLLSSHFYRKHKVGDIISRISNDIQNIRLSLALGLLHIVNTLFIFPFTIFQMTRISPSLTFFILLPIPISLLSVRFFVTRLYSTIKVSQQSLGKVTDFIIESFNNLVTIKHYSVLENFASRFKIHNDDLFKANIEQAKVSSKMFPFISVMSSVGYFILFMVGGKMIMEETLSVGQFVALSLYLSLLSWPTASLAWIINIIQRGKSSWERINEILTDDTLLRKDFNGANKLTQPMSFKIQNMSISINEKIILKNISMSIPSGKKIGIYGATGSGKTTLLRSISCLESIPKDTCYLNGNEIHTYNLDDIHSNINFVPQSPILFSDSISNNISYGDTPIEQLIEYSCLKKDISTFPDKLDTIIGEKGVILSGGQQSRVALARAFSKKCDLMILDDVFSAVDSETEKNILDHLLSSDSYKTLLLVSQRLSTLMHCDIIYILEHGEIIASGTHDELLINNLLYKKTWDYQQVLETNYE